MKFRAWVNGEGKKRMIKWDRIDAIEWCNDKLWYDAGKYCLLGNITLMQNTGLQDRKKKDIYQGDIISVDENEKQLYEVIWDKRHAGFGLIHAKRDGDDYGVYTRNIGLHFDTYKIHGNIYQNPELTTKVVAKK